MGKKKRNVSKPKTINKKAAKIFEVKDNIESLGNGHWNVLSESGNGWYKVSVGGSDKTSCECQYHKKCSGANAST